MPRRTRYWRRCEARACLAVCVCARVLARVPMSKRTVSTTCSAKLPSRNNTFVFSSIQLVRNKSDVVTSSCLDLCV
jgi:hypothetical protein